MKNLKIITLVTLGAAFLMSFTIVKTVNGDWNIPAKYKTMKNPTEASKANIAEGKTLYNKHCKSCHGAEGYGDGPKSDGLDGDMGDFSSAEFQKQSDGELFYKTTFGKDDMPKFSKKMPDDDDRWYVIHYLRTLAE